MKPIVISGHMTVIIFSCFPCSVCIMHCVIDGPRICSSLAKEIYGHKVQGTWTSVIFEGGGEMLDVYTSTREHYTYIQPLGGHSACIVLKSYVINAMYKRDWTLPS